MRRVVVIGCSGAGKSAFAKELSHLLSLRLYHLDEMFWGKGGPYSDRPHWVRVQEEIAEGQSWIIEGNYGGTIDARLQRADTVIFLDYKPVSCLAGYLRRVLLSKFRGARGETVVRGCNDRLTLKLIREAFSFRRRHRRGILRGVARFPGVTLVHLRNRGETKEFLASHIRSRPPQEQESDGPSIQLR